jgi:hypothetical protein
MHEIDKKLKQNFSRKPVGKRQLRTPMHRWEDNIRMNLREER